MSLRAVQADLAGWGRYPTERCAVYRPERLSELLEIVAEAPEPSLIGRGLGRSYGDASLNRDRGVVLHERFDRFIEFDPDLGIVRCEAAVSLAQIIDTLLPRGFCLPITPGTKHISVGGAIAADVHGKNHHRDGTISGQVIDFRILTGTGEVLTCSREEHADLFWATLGGMGLTGLILDARLRMRRAETSYVHSFIERTADLDSTLERILTTDRDYAYAAAWIDCLKGGRGLGRSVLFRANPASVADLDADQRAHPHAVGSPSWLRVPFNLPSIAINPVNMRLFNEGWYRMHRDHDAIVSYERFFYILDAVLHWNRVYGRRGVLQYQLVLPTETCRRGLQKILERITLSGRASFLAVLKSTGAASEGLLSFPFPGASLALDFPHTGPDLIALLHQLDDIVLEHGGRIYLAKDSCMRPEHFRASYPRLAAFREIKQKYDPQQRFSSSLARRLRILEEA